MWTKEEERCLLISFEERKLDYRITYRDIQKKYFPYKSPENVRSKAVKMGFRVTNTNFAYGRKYIVDESFWEIPNPLNCYYAGWLAADGCIFKRGEHSYVLIVNMHEKDMCLLEQFKKDIKYTGIIKKRQFYSRETLCKQIQIQISLSEKWRQDLENNFGIIPKKTYVLAPPNLNNNYLKLCYIIGYIDGDGSISQWERYRGGLNLLVISFCSSSEVILNWVKDICDFLFNIRLKGKLLSKVNKYKQRNCNSYVVRTLRAAVMIDFLRQFPVPKLDRKWNNPNVLQLIEQYRAKYPSYFSQVPNFPELQQSNNKLEILSI